MPTKLREAGILIHAVEMDTFFEVLLKFYQQYNFNKKDLCPSFFDAFTVIFIFKLLILLL
jgi:hypothetical protein